MANPVLKASTFDLYDYGSREGAKWQPMTVQGAALKGVFCGLIALISGSIAIHIQHPTLVLFGSLFIVSAVLCLFLRYFPTAAPLLAVMLSVTQGTILGIAAHAFMSLGFSIPAAVALFLGCLPVLPNGLELDICGSGEVFLCMICIPIVMCAACSAGLFKAKHSESFVLFGSLAGPLFYYILALITAQAGLTIIPPHSTPLIFIFCLSGSAVMCWPFTFCLSYDFDNIRIGAQSDVPRFMEWYCAFALMLTLTWYCVELICIMFYMAHAED